MYEKIFLNKIHISYKFYKKKLFINNSLLLKKLVFEKNNLLNINSKKENIYIKKIIYMYI